MSSAKITLIGFYRYMAERNQDLFKKLTLPDGIDKEILINSIMMDGGEFEVLYADPYFMQDMIGFWASKHNRTFQKWIDALNIEYDPLYNYDRTEEWTDNAKTTDKGTRTMTYNTSDVDTGSITDTGASSDTSTITHTLDTTVEGSTDGTSTTIDDTDDVTNVSNNVSAYNSSAMQPATTTDTTLAHDSTVSVTDHTDTSQSTTGTNTDSTISSGTDGNTREIDTDHIKTGTETNTDDLEHKNESSHKARMYGNIGVTTSQQMLESELDIAKWNIYKHIGDMFLEEFTIMIY